MDYQYLECLLTKTSRMHWYDGVREHEESRPGKFLLPILLKKEIQIYGTHHFQPEGRMCNED